jgi:RNA polymerase sigma-70 factor, ECF subfamily
MSEACMQDVCTDAEMLALLKDAQRGVPAAYDRLYNMYSDRIFRYVYARLGQREAAEDLTADVFVRLIQVLPRFHVNAERPVASFSAWLYRIAGNLLTDHHRRQRYRQHADIADHVDLAGNGLSPDQHAAATEQGQLIVQALTELEPEQQAVVLYRFAEQYSTQQVADLMGKTTGAVKALQHRALNNLRRLLSSSEAGR